MRPPAPKLPERKGPDERAVTSGNGGETELRAAGVKAGPSASPTAAPLLWAGKVPPPLVLPDSSRAGPAAALPGRGGLLAAASLALQRELDGPWSGLTGAIGVSRAPT